MKIEDKINCGSAFLSIFKNHILCDRSYIISFLNPYSFNIICEKDYTIDMIDAFFVDGGMLCKFYGFLYRKIERASFDYSSVASVVFNYLEKHSIKVGIIGATSIENCLAIERIMNKHPDLDVAYSRNGYLGGQEKVVVQDIVDSGCQVLIVGMGTPYQEDFSVYLKANSSNPLLIITCGGFLTQTSIRDDYYWPWIKRFKIFWLQRALLHGYVRKRLLVDYPKFVVNFFIRKKKNM